MGAAFVQRNSATGVWVLAFASNVTAGNSIIASIRSPDGAVTISDVRDNLGNILAVAAGPIRGSLASMSFWQFRVDNIVGGASTVTITPSSYVPTMSLELREVSGLDPAGSFGASASVVGGSGTPSVGTVTPPVADGVAIAMTTTDGGKPSNGAGWTPYDPGNLYWYDESEDQVITSTSPITGLFSGVSGNYDGLIVVYKAASGGAGAPPSDRGHARTYRQLLAQAT